VFLPEDRAGFRRMFSGAWRKRRDGLPATALETLIGDVVAEHPEYQALLERPEDAVGKEWTPEGGETNPFLHMAMHLAVREQVATDRPAGIAAEHARLAGRLGAHEAEHRMLEALGEALWSAQRNNSVPDEVSYLESLRNIGA
jgi:hypothetical protein